MDKERYLPKESYKTAYITFVRRDHLWNFLCNEDRNDSECGINHECDHMHIMECSNLFCILWDLLIKYEPRQVPQKDRTSFKHCFTILLEISICCWPNFKSKKMRNHQKKL